MVLISDIVLALALTGSLREKVFEDDVSSPTAAIRTKEDWERLVDSDKMSAIIDALDIDGDKQISPWELAELELKAAEVLSLELTPDDAFALADGSVREDGEPSTSYVCEEHVREWVVDGTWAGLLRIGDLNGDQVLDDSEWDHVVSSAKEGRAQLAELSSTDGWTSSFSDLLSADAASTGAAALAAAKEVVERLPFAMVGQRRRFIWIMAGMYVFYRVCSYVC